MNVSLRPAHWYDRGFVMRLRNDPDVIARGGGRRAYAGWWGDAKPNLFIIGLQLADMSRRAGYLIINPTHEVSIVVHPVCRGLGVGTSAMLLARHCYAPLTARVHADNPASLRMFEKAGFLVERQRDRELLLRTP